MEETTFPGGSGLGWLVTHGQVGYNRELKQEATGFVERSVPMGDYLDMISLAGLAPEDRFPAWRAIMRKKTEDAKTFEIYCWDQEAEWLDHVLPYGEYKDAAWDNGKVVTGQVTEEFIHMLITLPKPENSALYDKMTPFFSIFFDNGFSSEHYGTELFVWMDEP